MEDNTANNLKRSESWYEKARKMVSKVRYNMDYFWGFNCFNICIYNRGRCVYEIILYIDYNSIFLVLLQNILIKKQENNYCNVDLYMKEKVEGEIVWKLRADNSQEHLTYLCIKNIGKIDIFSIYIKVIKNDGTIGWFHISEMLNVEKECVVCVPYTRESIKEIVFTCSVQTECKTKKFNGIKSGNEDMTIFSNSELFDFEKYAIYHEKGFDVFERMERFFV